MHKMACLCHKKHTINQIRLRLLPLVLIVQLLCITTSTEANSNSFPSHFSKFPRHKPSLKHSEAASDSTSPLKTNNKTRLKSSKQDLEFLVELILRKAESARGLALNLTLSHHKAQTQISNPMKDCLELLDDTIDILFNIMNKGNTTDSRNASNNNDVHTWLSAAITNQETCIQSIGEVTDKSDQQKVSMVVWKNLGSLLSNSLSTFITSTKPRRLSSVDSPDSFPNWVSRSERKLLEAPVNELKVHAVVAEDGSGTHRSIGKALMRLIGSNAKDSGKIVIYVKAGTYHETIKIPTKQKDVMLVGDGKDKTVITSDKNAKDGWTTFQSATVAAMGNGFMARDITIINNAGPTKHQAVALRVGADRSVVFRCSILGYQDTLYAHSKRQFYRESDVYGTIDFIFGNAAAVLQNCNIFIRQPSSGHEAYVTAQGRTSPDQNTGFSIHNCKITAELNQTQKTSAYLGRPWKPYSRTVIMQSYLDRLIHPLGWAAWSSGSATKTLYYGEYRNSGPGSSVAGRVNWPGYHASLMLTDAEKFTVDGFIDGNVWLPLTGVSFISELLK